MKLGKHVSKYTVIKFVYSSCKTLLHHGKQNYEMVVTCYKFEICFRTFGGFLQICRLCILTQFTSFQAFRAGVAEVVDLWVMTQHRISFFSDILGECHASIFCTKPISVDSVQGQSIALIGHNSCVIAV